MTGTIITKKGMALIAKLLATGQELIFTRAAVGTGSIPKGYDPAGMIDLSQFEMNGEISGYSAENEEATVIFQISSQNVETGFMITEAGLFAEDADEGEILYAYLDLSDDPQYVYSNDSTIQKFAEIEFKTIVGAVENVTVITSPGALVTKDVFETEMEKLQTPEFDDYSGEDVEIPDARTAIAGVTSKKNIFSIFSNIKAALMGLVTLGEMRGLLVNNGLCNEPGKFFLDAAYGKNLQDQLTKLNSDLGYKNIENIFTYDETKLAIHAYVENNCVCITIVMKTTCPPNTEIKFTITDKKYLPRHLIFGAYGSGMSGLDHDKFNSAMIHDDGNCIIYLNDTLSWQEFVSFCYPCRIDQ